MNRTCTISMCVGLLACCLAPSARAQETFTYTGQPFSYVGTGGPPYVTSVSGYFTVSSPLAPNTTQLLTPESLGGTITDYSFTDGRYTTDIGNYATNNALGYGTGSTAPTFAVTTGPNGDITSWDLNILSPDAYINTWDVSSWSSTVYSSLYDEGTPGDGVVADPSQAYDAYNANAPGTWTVTPITQETFTYTGQPFSYVGTGGPPYVTSISGSFTVAFPLAPNTTQLLTPNTIGGTITDYSFTDGRYTVDIGNYATNNALGYGTGYSAPTFAVTTGPNGNIISWDLNILSPTAYINTWDVSSWSSTVYSSLYDEGTPGDGVVADPSQAYDAYNANAPGTWTVTPITQETFTYTGQPFSYVGTGGPPYVTSVSGYFTVAVPLAQNTTQLLTPESIGGTITDYSFTDGRYTTDIGNYATSNPLGYGTGYSAPTFAVTTGPNGNIISWDLNILSPTAYINTWNVSSWSSTVYSSLYDEGTPGDGVVADPSQAYDAYNANAPGTWTVTPLLFPSLSFTQSITQSNGQFTLSWPATHVGWILQTNAIDLTSTNSWAIYPGSTTTNAVVFTVSPNDQAVFFRLVP